MASLKLLCTSSPSSRPLRKGDLTWKGWVDDRPTKSGSQHTGTALYRPPVKSAGARDWSPSYPKHVRTSCPVKFWEGAMGGFGVFLLLLFLAFVLYMIIGAVLQGLKGATGLEVGCLYRFLLQLLCVLTCTLRSFHISISGLVCQREHRQVFT